jgi:NADP-dependent 3-hydroxy acid dehydrogenase YdfG
LEFIKAAEKTYEDRSSEGRGAIITDASPAIGAATARALAASGYRLALLARRIDRVEALARELDNETIAIEADVTNGVALVSAAERVHKELRGTEVLITNTTGVTLLTPLTSEQREEFRQMIEVNLLGAIMATEVFLDHLRDGGDLVNISSVMRSDPSCARTGCPSRVRIC